MKKLIATASCLALVTGASFAQTVNWGSISFQAVTAQTNATVYTSLQGGGTPTVVGTVGAAGEGATGAGYYYELLVGSVYTGTVEAAPTTLAGLASWTDSGLEASNSATAGRLQVMNANSAATATGLSLSVSNNIILVGWSANLGSTWAQAIADLQSSSYLASLTSLAFVGETSVGYVEASPSTVAGTTLFGGTATALGTPISSLLTQLDEVKTVPEPGTLALAALGGASLLMFRRKQK